RTKVQVELLSKYLRLAHDEHARQQAKITFNDGQVDEGEYVRFANEPPSEACARFVRYPIYRAGHGEIASLGRELSQIEGAKQLGATLLKLSNDVSAEYLAFVRKNLARVATMRLSNGEPAAFPSREAAEAARRRSPGRQKVVVVALGRAKNYVVFSPKEVIERKLWEGPKDNLVEIGEGTALEIIEKVNKHNARASLSDRRFYYPFTFDTVKVERQRLASMGLEDGPMLRAALREYVSLRTEPPRIDRVTQLIRALVGGKGIGIDFFPTAKGVAQSVVAKGDIKPGMSVLDPEGGYGALADEVRQVGVEPDVCELSATLREILQAKGYNIVGTNFLELTDKKKYDRIIMNPPFSDGLDIEHVRHAYSLLNPGGRIVAIMSDGAFYRMDKQAEGFRAWLEGLEGTDERLP